MEKYEISFAVSTETVFSMGNNTRDFSAFVLFLFCFLMLDLTLNIRDVEGRPSAFSEQHHKYCFGFYLTCSLIAQN